MMDGTTSITFLDPKASSSALVRFHSAYIAIPLAAPKSISHSSLHVFLQVALTRSYPVSLSYTT